MWPIFSSEIREFNGTELLITVGMFILFRSFSSAVKIRQQRDKKDRRMVRFLPIKYGSDRYNFSGRRPFRSAVIGAYGYDLMAVYNLRGLSFPRMFEECTD